MQLFGEKSGRFRIQDWLLTCAEQDINLLDFMRYKNFNLFNLKTNKRPTLKADKISKFIFIFVPSSKMENRN